MLFLKLDTKTGSPKKKLSSVAVIAIAVGTAIALVGLAIILFVGTRNSKKKDRLGHIAMMDNLDPSYGYPDHNGRSTGPNSNQSKSNMNGGGLGTLGPAPTLSKAPNLILLT